MCATKKRARDADAGPSSEPFSKHPAGAAQKPLPKSATILQRVVHALRARGGASSAPAIVKAVAEGGYTDGAKVRKAIKAGVTAGALQTSAESAAKFWVGGEPIPEAAAGPAVATEELSPGDAGGSPVAKGDAVAIDYTLSLLATGEKVEAGKKFCFTVGGGDVIKDMHRNGRRSGRDAARRAEARAGAVAARVRQARQRARGAAVLGPRLPHQARAARGRVSPRGAMWRARWCRVPYLQ